MNGNAKHLPRAVATVLLFVGLIAAYPITQADASSWPSRTVRIITGPAGSSSDAVVRTLAEVLSPKWKQAIVVENRPGGDHILAARAFLDAQDGHTLLFTTHSTLTVNPLLHERLPYDPVRDFAPITLAVEDFLCVVASPSLTVNSLSELVDLARAKPGTLNSYAVPGSPHLSWLAFQGHSGITTAFIPYTSPANVLVDLSEGRIHVALMPLAAVLGQARAGKVKLLAVTNATRTPAAPDTPTFVEAGYPNFAFGGLLGLFGPEGHAGGVARAHQLRCAHRPGGAGRQAAADQSWSGRKGHHTRRVLGHSRRATREVVRHRPGPRHHAQSTVILCRVQPCCRTASSRSRIPTALPRL